MSGERERILERVREALQFPAQRPGATHGARPAASPGTPAISRARQWLPQVPDSFAERLELFRQTATDLKADFRLVSSREELATQLAALRKQEGWTLAAAHGGELTDFACQQLGLPTCRTDKGYQVSELERCSVGLTECDALIAQTGSVLITSRSAGGRALSVLPPHHVVLARREQLLPDLPSAFAWLKEKYAGNYPSFISFITGPSRTGDIERILVLGAHGPKQLTIFCL